MTSGNLHGPPVPGPSGARPVRRPSRAWYLIALVLAALGMIGARVIVVQSGPDFVAEISTGKKQHVTVPDDGLTIFWREGMKGPPCSVTAEGRAFAITLSSHGSTEAPDGTLWFPLYETRDPVPPGEYTVECDKRAGRYAVGTHGVDPSPEVYYSFVGGLILAIVAALIVFVLRWRRRPRRSGARPQQ